MQVPRSRGARSARYALKPVRDQSRNDRDQAERRPSLGSMASFTRFYGNAASMLATATRKPASVLHLQPDCESDSGRAG